jgi:hypothetical protein
MGLFSGIKNIVDDVFDAGSGFVGGVTGQSQADAGKQAEKIAKLNADLVRKETAEQIKRLEQTQAQTLGATVARQGASGIQVGAGTTDDFLSEMQKSFQADIDWRKEAGARQAKVVDEGGNLVNQQAIAAGWGTAANSTLAIASLWI